MRRCSVYENLCMQVMKITPKKELFVPVRLASDLLFDTLYHLSVGHLHDVQTANGGRNALASSVEARHFDSRTLLLEAVNRRSGEGFHLKSVGYYCIGCGEALLKGVHFVGRHKEVYRCAGGEESLLVQFGYCVHLVEGNGGEACTKESLFANAAWAAFKCGCGEGFATREGFFPDGGYFCRECYFGKTRLCKGFR